MIGKSSRLLALNVRARYIGYALFEGSDRLLDWGTRVILLPDADANNRHSRIASFLTMCSPSVIAVHRARRKLDVNAGQGLLIVSSLNREAALRSIPLFSVSHKDVRKTFGAFGAHNKYDIATATASVFPEIRWKLPPGRKRWQAEPRVMLVFDALAAGLTYWQQRGHPLPLLGKSGAHSA